MSIIATVKRWLSKIIRKKRRDDLLTGVSATPDFPEPTSLMRWILMNYRPDIDRAACFSLEHLKDPFIRMTYEEPVEIKVSYSPPFSPNDRLKAIGLPLPKGFALTDWKRHAHFTITGPRLRPDDMAIFLDLLFRKLYRVEKGYVIAAWTETKPATKAPHPTPQKKSATP